MSNSIALSNFKASGGDNSNLILEMPVHQRKEKERQLVKFISEKENSERGRSI